MLKMFIYIKDGIKINDIKNYQRCSGKFKKYIIFR